MEEEKYLFDLSMFERFAEEERLYSKHQPWRVLADKNGNPLMVRCSAKPDPAYWSIVGHFFDVNFRTRRELDAYIKERGLRPWTKEDDDRAGRHLSNFCKSNCKIF